MRKTVQQWLEEGIVDLFLGYRAVEGHPIPWVFRKDALHELEAFREGPYRYPLEKLAVEILREDPRVRLGLLARSCTERAVTVLQALHALDRERLILLQEPCCPSPLHRGVVCSSLAGPENGSQKRRDGIPRGRPLEELETWEADERFSRWMHELEKCLKCYGCRDVCPVCFCDQCTLQDPELFETGSLPAEAPHFHLVRAVHMAGRCVDCGLCEEACPVDIPLRTLYRKVGALVRDLYGYVPGHEPVPLLWGPLGDGELERLVAGERSREMVWEAVRRCSG
ncbi:Formate hydrogenlyase subunit 6/NADH:ubiquinone oxidoreductase subunit (chain I) [Desulfacinum infernum DSM 9756]|uniref:Formate hydrogenlyase subunit 6/NADH:ubiquinone oxidoreductase subunit (Chain I) n=1 Tax=Desulfacinum infernum DSM 9756 TaxID=1121391 RepID=A0A1M5CX96_9BACT|nr:4Fe-4S binding protein [Desulfacinum infernum]SHF59324.1 Formate hydrogenlyase subunit 6/NADH:ubiquinone oxidoreductase subunit (chain I) [Desulfacinum infernum DSM 9756]